MNKGRCNLLHLSGGRIEPGKTLGDKETCKCLGQSCQSELRDARLRTFSEQCSVLRAQEQ